MQVLIHILVIHVTHGSNQHIIIYDCLKLMPNYLFRCILHKHPCYNSHYSDVIMSAVASQITGVSIVYSTVCSSTWQRNSKSFASLGFVRGIHRQPMNSFYKGPVTRKMFPFDEVIITIECLYGLPWCNPIRLKCVSHIHLHLIIHPAPHLHFHDRKITYALRFKVMDLCDIVLCDHNHIELGEVVWCAF